MDEKGLCDLLGKYTTLMAYANAVRVKADTGLLRVKRQMELAEADELRKRPTLNNSRERWRKDAVIASIPEIQDLREDSLVLEQTRKTAEMYAQNYRDYVAALSRELTRRTSLPESLRQGIVPE